MPRILTSPGAEEINGIIWDDGKNLRVKGKVVTAVNVCKFVNFFMAPEYNNVVLVAHNAKKV